MTRQETLLCASRPPTPESKNLVVFIDGTSKQFGSMNTNVVKLCKQVVKNDAQLTYYSSGLGTLNKPGDGSWGDRFSSAIDMAIGRNLDKGIMASYRWLSDHYRDGDRIFLFGYSRGAYQVRALAGMITRVGLLLPGNSEQVPFAFDWYLKSADEHAHHANRPSVISRRIKPPTTNSEDAKLATLFQETFCRKDVHIHFVGVWDTVSSVGLGRTNTLPCTTSSCEHICYFRHALALDERRVKFLPEYVYGGRSYPRNDGRIKEVWFAGSHSDVGGGNRQNEKFQSGDIPLLWMRNQVIAAGLELEPSDVMWKSEDLNEITPSLTLGWWFLELLPLRRALYYNSDQYTYRPHFGSPRRILPGQKVHVSALFKHNYKPYARFYGNPEKWPDPMFWNDENSHQRLQGLSDSWERDIFDDQSVRTLIHDLKQGKPNLDALDRLAFMAGFDICKTAILHDEDARNTLAICLRGTRLIMLSAAVVFCELGWDWPSEMSHIDFAEYITYDISQLLNGEDRLRACMYLPSLCKRDDLRAKLVNKGNLRFLVQFCDSTGVAQQDEGTSTVAFHSAQALSVLMKLDKSLTRTLVENDAVKDICKALHSNCGPALVAVLSVIDGLAKDDKGRAAMKTGPIIATLMKLIRQFDDFVAPAAIRALCSLLSEADLRKTMIGLGVVPTLLVILNQGSDEAKQVTSEALVQFARYDDMRKVLFGDGYVHKLAKRVQSHLPGTRDGAIDALLALGKSEGPIGAQVTQALKEARTINVLVARLGQKSTALAAAWTLARLAKIGLYPADGMKLSCLFVLLDALATMIAGNMDARANILGMLRQRWFDGLRGEDGLKVLSDLLDCERLRLAILEAGAIDVVRGMINCTNSDTTYAGLHYLRCIARLDASDKDTTELGREKTSSLIPPLVSALRVPHKRVQKAAIQTLRSLPVDEDLRTQLVGQLLDLLKDQKAGVVLAASVMLRILAIHKSVRETVVTEEAFWSLQHQYYDSLKLEYDDKGPRIDDVYASIGSLIKSMQEVDMGDEERREFEEAWLERVPYELRMPVGHGLGLCWIAMLMCCLVLLLFGLGQGRGA